MNNASKVIFYKLSNTSAVTNVVTDNIFALQRIQLIEAPAITYQLISLIPTNSKGSASVLDKTRVQVNCYTIDYDKLVTLTEAVRTALEQPDSAVVNSVNVQCITFEGLNPSFDNNSDNEGVFYCSLDFIVTHGR